MKYFIIYCSPAGTTEHVAKNIGTTLKEFNGDVFIKDIGKKHNRLFALDQIKAAKETVCLYVGTPVYGGHTVLPVMTFIDELPESKTGFAVPFVTWGGVTSGVALWEMGKKLLEKGYKLAAGAKIGAVHSMQWQSKDPVCKGHPDKDDDKVITELVTKIHKALSEGNLHELQLQDLDYQPEMIGAELKKNANPGLYENDA